MNPTISAAKLETITGPLSAALTIFAGRYPGEPARRQPVHTVYGGAHIFKPDTAVKLGRMAVRSFEDFAPDASSFADTFNLKSKLADLVFARVAKKLAAEAVEDFRIDFEDGYGVRPEAEEDGHAIAAAQNVANGMADGTLPPFIGIRIKPFSLDLHTRSIRTLDLFLINLVTASNGKLPDNFVVTLPKVEIPEQVALLVKTFEELESNLGMVPGSLKMELMIETAQSIILHDGSAALPKLIEAARGRCTGAHFGAFDYTSSCGITSEYQDILHPACDFARNMMQVSLAGTGAWLADSVTTILPIAPHRGDDLTAEQIEENRVVIHHAWKMHYDRCRHSLANGFFQSWDLHPAQIPARYAAVYAFFLEGLDAASERLRNFLQVAGQATLVRDNFDDAATGQGLLNYFRRALNCGAITEEETTSQTGITLEELRTSSFVKIIKNRQK
ncbi:aldolase/citrate lyase family protein [soil metagenome]